MSKVERIEEINTYLDTFWLSGIYNVLIIGLFIVLTIVGIIYWRTKNKDVAFYMIMSYLLIGAIAGIFIETEKSFHEANLAVLENHVMVVDSAEKVEVETTSITQSIIVNDRYCLEADLPDGEHCTYLQFQSAGEVTQVLIPLSKNIFADKDNPLKITYYKLPKEKQDEINTFLEIKHLVFGDNVKLYEYGWAIGTEVKSAN